MRNISVVTEVQCSPSPSVPLCETWNRLKSNIHEAFQCYTGSQQLQTNTSIPLILIPVLGIGANTRVECRYQNTDTSCSHIFYDICVCTAGKLVTCSRKTYQAMSLKLQSVGKCNKKKCNSIMCNGLIRKTVLYW